MIARFLGDSQVRWMATIAVAVTVCSISVRADNYPAPGVGKIAIQVQQAMNQANGTEIPVIVRTTPGSTDPVVDKVKKSKKLIGDYSLISGFAISLLANDIADLAADPTVLSISPDAPIFAAADQRRTVATVSAELAVQPQVVSPLLGTLGLPSGGFTGKGVGVAIVDSGIEQTADVTDIQFYDFVNRRMT